MFIMLTNIEGTHKLFPKTKLHVHASGIEFPTPLVSSEHIWYTSQKSVHQTSHFVSKIVLLVRERMWH